MIYQSTSINEVIARIIRNTRIIDSTYILDMREWIPEAMGYMRTNVPLVSRWEDVVIDFHKGKLPCDLNYIKAVEYSGGRLSEGLSSKTLGTPKDFMNSRVCNAIEVAPTSMAIPVGTQRDTVKWVSDFTDNSDSACSKACLPGQYYQIEMGYITTSFCDGVVRIHYAAQPTDSEGLPLIPDNENYKQALYWYVRAMMMGAGYPEAVYREEEMMNRFETYAARAIGEISYPSVDSMGGRVVNQVRFIPDAGYFDNFFGNSQPEQMF